MKFIYTQGEYIKLSKIFYIYMTKGSIINKGDKYLFLKFCNLKKNWHPETDLWIMNKNGHMNSK